MHEVKADFSVQLPSNKISTELPQIIVSVYSSNASFPKTRPSRQIKINEVNIWKKLGGRCIFNRLAIIRSGYHPHFFESANLLNPVPANTGFRTPLGFARICGHEDS
jgi:hypothetical protein